MKRHETAAGRHALPRLRWALRALTLSGALGLTAQGFAQEEALPSVLTGAYSEEQASHGQQLYYQHCLSCHGETLEGVDKAPALTGPAFNNTWNAAPLAALLTRILSMPPEKPASLSRQEGVAILSYVLWYNGLPLGAEALDSSPELLSRIPYQTPQGQ